MTKINSSRVKQILADEDFQGVVERVRRSLTSTVMSNKTSDEDRVTALAEYHALNTLMSHLRAEASNHKDDEND